MKVTIYVPDSESDAFKAAQARMKAEGQSLSSIILSLLKTHTAFFEKPKRKGRS